MSFGIAGGWPCGCAFRLDETSIRTAQRNSGFWTPVYPEFRLAHLALPEVSNAIRVELLQAVLNLLQ